MLSLAFAGPVPTETGKIALSFTYAIHVVSSWGVLFWSCGPCLLDMGRFEIFMGRFGFGHGAFCRLTGRLNPAQSSQSKFQETIVPRVLLVPHVGIVLRVSA